jgi:hypothetical protein
MFTIRKLKLKPVSVGLANQAILYTLEDSYHVEFLIRLAILNLGEGWSHTVVCSRQNQYTIEQVCAAIDSQINIISINEHSMLTSSFWDQFTGSHLLFYDADSCITGPLTGFLSYDFVGHKTLTLRNREVMLRCLSLGQSKGVREDVFFKHIIRKHGLGNICHEPLPIMWKPWQKESWKDDVMKLIGKQYQTTSNIIIYILCYNQDRVELAKEQYRAYSWAKPLLMKYQDYSFENAVWKQLLEIQDEWISCEFVGTLSFTAKRKINIDTINRRITEGYYTGKPYVNFNCSTRKILEHKGKFHHPNFKEIWCDMLRDLKIEDVNENACNYWMCAPELMVRFIEWHHKVLLPVLLAHPLIFTDAEYGGAMTPKELIELWGQPYYPHVPFILERINKAFFDYFV